MEYSLTHTNQGIFLARGGGGGSSSSGGGGGSSSSSSSSSRSYSSSSGGGSGDPLPWWGTSLILFACFGIPIVILAIAIVTGAKKGKAKLQPPQGFIDPKKNPAATEAQKKQQLKAEKVFVDFQDAWSRFDLNKMRTITTPEYYKKMVLHLNVLKNYQRQNIMENVSIVTSAIQLDGKQPSVFFAATATDKLVDTKDDKVLYTDSSVFTEIWHLKDHKGKLLLDSISQTTEDKTKHNSEIEQFATKNKFFFDPDFGWLMMPSRGAIFGATAFGNADINNHVVGYHQDKVVEFYSYEPKAGAGMQPFVVAQAILPKHYSDILVTEKSWYNFKPKIKGLQKIETESVEFNKKFAVWAAEPDKVNSFELLATNFMERIYALEFEVHIEVIDNVLYLYSQSSNVSYSDMLEVLSWAFDEMKM